MFEKVNFTHISTHVSQVVVLIAAPTSETTGILLKHRPTPEKAKN